MELNRNSKGMHMSKVKHAVRAAGVAVVLTLTLSSCWTYTTSTNKVVTGNIAYFYFRRAATNNVVDTLHYSVNGGDERATLSAMLGFAKSNVIKNKLSEVAFYVSDFDYFFDPDNDGDFEEAAANTHNNSRCLVMHRNANPLGDRHNWTYRESSDQYCDIGKGFI